MRNRNSTSNERCVRMRNINRQTYLLHAKLGQARQNFPLIEVFVKPRRQVRRIPLAQRLGLSGLSGGPTGFGTCTVSRDANRHGYAAPDLAEP